MTRCWSSGRKPLLGVCSDTGSNPVGGQPISEVVRRLGAVLASDERQAEIAIGTRCSSYETGDLAQALAAGTIIKVFTFRGVMHYVSPQDGVRIHEPETPPTRSQDAQRSCVTSPIASLRASHHESCHIAIRIQCAR